MCSCVYTRDSCGVHTGAGGGETQRQSVSCVCCLGCYSKRPIIILPSGPTLSWQVRNGLKQNLDEAAGVSENTKGRLTKEKQFKQSIWRIIHVCSLKSPLGVTDPCISIFWSRKRNRLRQREFSFCFDFSQLGFHWKWMDILPLANPSCPNSWKIWIFQIRRINCTHAFFSFWMWNLEFIPFLLYTIKSKIFILWVWKSNFWSQMYLSTYSLEAFFPLQFGENLKTNTSMV